MAKGSGIGDFGDRSLEPLWPWLDGRTLGRGRTLGVLSYPESRQALPEEVQEPSRATAKGAL